MFYGNPFIQWGVALLISIIGGLLAQEYAEDIRAGVQDAWETVKAFRGYIIGGFIGIGATGGFFLADQLPWSTIFSFAAGLSQAIIVGWVAYMLWRLNRINKQQIRILKDMEQPRQRTDGGTTHSDQDEPDTTGAGLIGGAVAGAAIGSTFGPQGTVAGAIIGAVLGDELEKNAEEENP